MQLSSWEIQFVTVCILSWPVGRVFLNQGIFGPVLVGLIIIGIPTATVANFDAKLSSELLAISIWLMPILACFLLLLKQSPLHRSDLIASAALTVIFISVVLLALCAFDQTQYVMSERKELLYNSHDGYYAAVPFELIRADYGSRLRVANLYPVEWKTYYFLSGSIAATILKWIDHPTLIDFYNSKLLITLLSYFSIIESIIICNIKNYNYQLNHIFLNKNVFKISIFIIPISFVTFMLCWWYGESFQWNMNTSGGISITAGFLFFYFRLNSFQRESYLWLAIAAVAGFRNAPAIAMAFPFLVYWDFSACLKKILKFKLKLWGTSFLKILHVLWPTMGILLLGLIYALATVGHGQDSLFNLPNARFKLSLWYLSPICSAILESLSGFISKVPSLSTRFHSLAPVGIFSAFGLFLLFSFQAFLKRSNNDNGNQFKTMKYILFGVLSIVIVAALLNQADSASEVKPLKLLWEILKDLVALLLIIVLPMHLFNIMLPERHSKVLLAIAVAHFIIFTITKNDIGVPAYQLVYYCYLAALVWMWTSSLSKQKLLTLFSIIVLAVMGGGPWFNIGDVYNKQNSIASKYDLKLELNEAKDDLIANTDLDGVFCGTGQFLRDDAIATYFGVRRGWDSHIALENTREIISLRMSQVTASPESRAAFIKPESDYCK